MTRLYTDGFEFGDALFFESTTGTVTIQGTTFRSGAYAMQVNGLAANYGQKSVTADDELYFRFGFRMVTGVVNIKMFAWYKGATELGSIRLNASNKIDLYTGTGTLAASGVAALLVNTWYLIEVHVKIADAAGVIETRIDGIVDQTFSGDTKPGADTQMDVFRLGFVAAVANQNIFFDDIAVDDAAYPGDGKIVLLTPNADGDVVQLTPSAGSNYQNVDELPPDSDTTYNSANATNYDLYNMTTFSLPAGAVVNLVYPEARAREDVAAADSINLGLKTVATEYDGSNQTVTTAYKRYVGNNYLVNPNTAAAWTQAQLDALQVKFQVV